MKREELGAMLILGLTVCRQWECDLKPVWRSVP